MGTIAMPRRFTSVLKLSLLLATVVLTGVGICWVGDLISGETAKETALYTLGIVGVLTVGGLVISSLGGGPSGPSQSGPPTGS
jgi:hypothetical protein